MNALGKRLLDILCGANHSVTDQELIQWIRGESIRSKSLKDGYGLHDPARDESAFRRLKTVISFLRERMGYRGFLIAFDEGTRTASFRRGSARQKQAIENKNRDSNQNTILKMIELNAEMELDKELKKILMEIEIGIDI